jgi:hypothetical protein
MLPQSCPYGSAGGIAVAKARENPISQERDANANLASDRRIETDWKVGFGEDDGVAGQVWPDRKWELLWEYM